MMASNAIKGLSDAMNDPATILIVDDEPLVLDTTARMLRAAGYAICTAADGAECLQVARAEHPDLILLDVMLPDQSGIEICRLLKADAACRDCLVLLASALQTSSDSQADGLECGAEGYITRPVSKRELLARVRVWLRVKRAEDALRRSHDRLEEAVALRTAELQRVNDRLHREIRFREQAERERKLNESRLQALLTLNQKSAMQLPDIADYILEESILLSQSRVGFLGFLTSDERVCTIHAWSETAMAACRVNDRYLDFVIADSGIWGECVRQRAPFVLNEYQGPHGLKRGLPAGHVALSRFLAVPVFEDDCVAAVVAVGNKPGPYDEGDIRQLTLLGDGMIRVLQKRRAEQELHQAMQMAEEARKAAEEAHQQIVRQNDELHEVISKKDKFFSIVAHDIKNPLASFASFVNLFSVKLGEWNPHEIEHLMEALQENVENLSALLDNLLTWARLEQGHLEIHPQQFALSMLVDRNIALLEPMAEQKTLMLRHQIASDIVVYADVNTTDMVLRNLLTNALKFTDVGGEITVSAEQQAGEVMISVTDTGVGMTPETMNGIFRIDVQHHKIGTQGEKGTGLGLVLCKEFVEKNGGRIRAESVRGEGSAFTFTLPAAWRSL